jgi:tuberculosinol/isotuberculosinol synthase
MDLDAFLDLPTEEVARLVREAGPKVCVFPINGTRRWFMLEHVAPDGDGRSENYLDVMTKRHIELYQLFFDHGVDTLLTPIFGPDLLERGHDYVRMAIEGMARLGTHPDFLTFYESYDVRVRFYGEYQAYLDRASSDYLSRIFDGVTKDTLSHKRYRLFFGVFAHDAVETVARLSAAFYDRHRRVPNKRALVELYYGEHVAPVDFFIGFDRFSAFDMPLVSTGAEDLYFTVAPSPYLTARQLRVILYDHLYVRPDEENDYSNLTSRDWNLMRDFYRANLENTQGVGARKKRGSFWYPLPQVQVPESLRHTS